MTGTLAGAVRARLGAGYRRAAAPWGRRAVARLRAGDLIGDGLGRALLAIFDPPDIVAADPVAARIDARREAIAAAPTRYGYVPVATPHGPARWATIGGPGPTVTSRWLARSASIPSRWGRVLQRCADAVPPGSVLELGALLGISGAFLAHGRGCTELITIEGSPVFADLAAATLAEAGRPARLVRGTFEEGLGAVLAGGRASISLAYLDGHHDGAATRHYVARIAPALVPGGLMLLDDITLNAGMWEAWSALCRSPGWSAAIHTGRLGVLVREPGAAVPRVADLSRYSGWWPVGGERAITTLPPDATR